MVSTDSFSILAKDCDSDNVVFPEAKIFLGFWCISKGCFEQVFPLICLISEEQKC